jgi:mono/diheme cytochrome c family protein
MRSFAFTTIFFVWLGAAVASDLAADRESGAAAAAAAPSVQDDAAASEDPAAAQEKTGPSEGSARAAPSGSEGGRPFDVKSSFRNICSFCHQDYGRHAGKGPQLMDSPRSDEFLFNRIKHGLAGRMPGFGSTYTDEQIRQIVKFIRNLKPGEEPKNPA